MFKSTEEYDNAMKSVLECVRDEKDNNFLVSSEDIRCIVAKCVSLGYLEGIETMNDADGHPHVYLVNPRITRSGLAYLETH